MGLPYVGKFLMRFPVFACIIFNEGSLREELMLFATWFAAEKVMLLSRYAISLWDVMLLSPNEICVWEFMLFAALFACETSFQWDFIPFKGHNYHMRFHDFWVLRDFVMRCHALGALRAICRCHILKRASSAFFSCVLTVNVIGLLFLVWDNLWWDGSYAFWPWWDVLVSVDAFLLHNFRARNIYPDEMSCFFGWGVTSLACES